MSSTSVLVPPNAAFNVWSSRRTSDPEKNCWRKLESTSTHDPAQAAPIAITAVTPSTHSGRCLPRTSLHSPETIGSNTR